MSGRSHFQIEQGVLPSFASLQRACSSFDLAKNGHMLIFQNFDIALQLPVLKRQQTNVLAV